MTEFNTKFKQKLTTDLLAKDISQSSINLYLRNLEKINGNQPLKNLKFLNDVESVETFLQPYKENTIRNYFISCTSILGLDKSTKPKLNLYNKYFSLMMDKNKTLKAEEQKGEKTESQKKNWIEWGEVLKTYENLKVMVDSFKTKSKLNDKEYTTLLQYIVLSLYTLIPPRRNDYKDLFVVNKDNENLSTACNYLVLSTKKLIFNRFKTDKKEGSVVIDIPDNLMESINTYMKFHPLLKGKKLKTQIIPFLCYSDGKPLDKINSITRVLNSIFKLKIGSSLLRHSYLSSKYGSQLQEQKQDAKEMSHSVGTAINNYIKT